MKNTLWRIHIPLVIGLPIKPVFHSVWFYVKSKLKSANLIRILIKNKDNSNIIAICNALK